MKSLPPTRKTSVHACVCVCVILSIEDFNSCQSRLQPVHCCMQASHSSGASALAPQACRTERSASGCHPASAASRLVASGTLSQIHRKLEAQHAAQARRMRSNSKVVLFAHSPCSMNIQNRAQTEPRKDGQGPHSFAERQSAKFLRLSADCARSLLGWPPARRRPPTPADFRRPRGSRCSGGRWTRPSASKTSASSVTGTWGLSKPNSAPV